MSSSYLNGENILRKVYDPATEGLRTTTIATLDGGTVTLSIDQTTDSIKVGDGVDILQINTDGSINTLTQNSIVPVKFDSIFPTYPNTTTEIYTYKNSGSTVATVTILYVDATKNQLISVVRT